MTEDYKKLTLDYITGNLNIEGQGTNSLRDTPSFYNNFFIECESRYGFTPDTIMYLTTNTTSNFIIYGTYNDNGTYRGYIAVLNQNGGLETAFTTFDSGTKLSYINKLQYAEDGNIYGLDDVDGRQRIILLNNVALKTATGYSCRLRSSYYLPDEYQTLWAGWDYDTPGYIKKAQGKSTYYLWGETQGSGEGTTRIRPTLIKFVINVGSSNEWTVYYGATVSNDVQSSDFFIEEGEENDTVVGIITYYSGVARCVLQNGTFTEVATYPRPTGATSFETCRIIDIDSFYCATRNTSAVSSIYRCDNGAYTLINSRTMPDTNYRRYLNYTNGILFDKIRYYDSENQEGNTYIGVYDGTTYISEEVPFVYKISGLEVINNFGLYQMLIQDENVLIKPSYVNYGTSYSGESYTSYNSLVPLHSELYSNGNIIFARNLYNKQSYQNTTTSTVNVPNNYINDIQIAPKNLLSATMTGLVSDSTQISKNVYENLFINYINKINVIDEDTSTSYPNVANYINVGVNTGTEEDYEGSMLGKIRLNYENGSLIQTIVWTDISTNDLIAKETSFSVDVQNPILTVDFINYDETFIYLTKSYDFELGKTYTISQKIRIE